MAKTYIDSAKAKAREKLHDFIKEKLHFKSPLEMKVMCFPGAEKDGEEALEVKEVYDRLCIPRENIYGIELCQERYERLQKADLGINVYNLDALDFFRKTDEVFDIISLDYTGKIGDDEIETVQEIARSGKLGRNGILHTNFFGSRENLRDKISLYMNTALFSPDSVEGNFDSNLLELIANKAEAISLDKLRNGISPIICGLMSAGKYSSGVSDDHIYFSSPVRLIAEHNMKKAFTDICNDGLHNASIYELESRNISRPLSLAEILANPHHSGTVWAYFNRIALSEYLSPIIFDNNVTAARGLLYLLEARHCKGYFLAGNELYRYISNSGSPMLMDLFYFRKFEDELKHMDDIFLVSNGKILYNPLGLSQPKILRKLRRIMDSIKSSFVHQTFFGREFLGSSYSKQKRHGKNSTNGKLPKEDLIYLIQSGIPTDEIVSAYPSHTKKEIAGIKSWLTKRANVSRE